MALTPQLRSDRSKRPPQLRRGAHWKRTPQLRRGNATQLLRHRQEKST